MPAEFPQHTGPIQEYLNQRGRLRLDFPVPLTSTAILDQLITAGIPPEWPMIEPYFRRWLENDDEVSMSKLLHYSTDYHVLSRVVEFFFGKKVSTNYETNPLAALQEIISHDLIYRLNEYERNAFVLLFIGQPTYHTDPGASLDLLRNMLNDLGLTSNTQEQRLPAPPPRDLRLYCTLNYLTLSDEEALEEWLITAFKVDAAVTSQIRASQAQWHRSLQVHPDSPEPTDAQYLIQQFFTLHEISPAQALEYLKKMPLAEQTHLAPIIVKDLVKQNHTNLAIEFLRMVLMAVLKQKNNLTQGEIKEQLLSLVPAYIITAQEESILVCFNEIDQSAFSNLLNSMGVNGSEFCLILFQWYLDTTPLNDQQLSSTIGQLLTDASKKPNQRFISSLYSGLLATRIYLFGEQGIIFPPTAVWQADSELCIYLAIKHGRDNNLPKFLFWLGQSHCLIGTQAVLAIYQRLEDSEPR